MYLEGLAAHHAGHGRLPVPFKKAPLAVDAQLHMAIHDAVGRLANPDGHVDLRYLFVGRFGRLTGTLLHVTNGQSTQRSRNDGSERFRHCF